MAADEDFFDRAAFPGTCDACNEEGPVVRCEEVWHLPEGGTEVVAYVLCRDHALAWLLEGDDGG